MLEVSLYLLTFTNGKSYVGISKRPNVRFREHQKRAQAGWAHAIYQAWRKHGAPKMEIIGKATNYETGFAMEVALIEKLGTKAPRGYNMTDGGDSLIGVIRGDAWRMKVAEKNRDRATDPQSREFNRKITAQRWSDPEQRAKMNVAREAAQADLRANNPEWVQSRAEKAAATMRAKWQDPEYLAKMAQRKPPVISTEKRKESSAKRLANMGAEKRSEIVKRSWATRKASQSGD